MANKKITQLDAVQEALGTDWLPVGREGSNQGTKVSIEQIEEYVEQTIQENASAGTSDDDLATIGYVKRAVADAGGGTIELETEINSVNPSNSKVPTSEAVVTYVSEGLADKVNTNQIGVANGVAPLGADGKIPTANLPSILPNDVMQDPGGGTPGQILQKTEDGYEWGDMPSIEDGEGTGDGSRIGFVDIQVDAEDGIAFSSNNLIRISAKQNEDVEILVIDNDFAITPFYNSSTPTYRLQVSFANASGSKIQNPSGFANYFMPNKPYRFQAPIDFEYITIQTTTNAQYLPAVVIGNGTLRVWAAAGSNVAQLESIISTCPQAKSPFLKEWSRRFEYGSIFFNLGQLFYRAVVATDIHGNFNYLKKAISLASLSDGGEGGSNNRQGAVLLLGDFVNGHYNAAEVASFKGVVKKMCAHTSSGNKNTRAVPLPVIGNHDVGNSRSIAACCTISQAKESFIDDIVTKNNAYYTYSPTNSGIKFIILNCFETPDTFDDSSAYWEEVTYDSSKPSMLASHQYNVGDIVNCGDWNGGSYRCIAQVTTPSNIYDGASVKIPRLKLQKGLVWYSEAQLEFLVQELGNVSAGTTVVILAHCPPSYVAAVPETSETPEIPASGFKYIESKFNAGSNSFSSYNLFSYCASSPVVDIVNAFINRSQGSIDVIAKGDASFLNVEGNNDKAFSVSYDFSSAKGDFGCYLTGHTHRDYTLRHSQYTDQYCLSFCSGKHMFYQYPLANETDFPYSPYTDSFNMLSFITPNPSANTSKFNVAITKFGSRQNMRTGQDCSFLSLTSVMASSDNQDADSDSE